MATRKTQPYRAAAPRVPGAALNAMMKGRSASGFNPADIHRAALLTGARKKTRSGQRAPRPTRPVRPTR